MLNAILVKIISWMRLQILLPASLQDSLCSLNGSWWGGFKEQLICFIQTQPQQTWEWSELLALVDLKNHSFWRPHGWEIYDEFPTGFGVGDSADVYILMIMVAHFTLQGLQGCLLRSLQVVTWPWTSVGEWRYHEGPELRSQQVTLTPFADHEWRRARKKTRVHTWRPPVISPHSSAPLSSSSSLPSWYVGFPCSLV